MIAHDSDPACDAPKAPMNVPACLRASHGVNQYTNIDGQLLQYDAKGNLTSGAAHLTATAMDYTYDAQNRLTDARPTSPAEGDKRMTFVYDGRNRCANRKTYTRSSGLWSLKRVGS